MRMAAFMRLTLLGPIVVPPLVALLPIPVIAAPALVR